MTSYFHYKMNTQLPPNDQFSTMWAKQKILQAFVEVFQLFNNKVNRM